MFMEISGIWGKELKDIILKAHEDRIEKESLLFFNYYLRNSKRGRRNI